MSTTNQSAAAGLIAALALFASAAVPAGSHETPDAVVETIRALQARVAELERQIEQLEKLKPSFAGFMPRFSERLHVLHRAGDVGDWQVAKHELLQLQRLVDVSEAMDPELGRMFKGFMSGPLSALDAAIEHGDGERFRAGLERTVRSCNACHRAVGSEFIRVRLEVPSMMSMRHGHGLEASSVEEMEHTHED